MYLGIVDNNWIALTFGADILVEMLLIYKELLIENGIWNGKVFGGRHRFDQPSIILWAGRSMVI